MDIPLTKTDNIVIRAIDEIQRMAAATVTPEKSDREGIINCKELYKQVYAKECQRGEDVASSTVSQCVKRAKDLLLIEGAITISKEARERHEQGGSYIKEIRVQPYKLMHFLQLSEEKRNPKIVATKSNPSYFEIIRVNEENTLGVYKKSKKRKYTKRYTKEEVKQQVDAGVEAFKMEMQKVCAPMVKALGEFVENYHAVADFLSIASKEVEVKKEKESKPEAPREEKMEHPDMLKEAIKQSEAEPVSV